MAINKESDDDLMRQIDSSSRSFVILRETDKLYIDKSLLIKDMIENNDCGVYLYTRPRRFGKTTNLTMLDAFFNVKYNGNTWFDDLKISQYPRFEKYKNAFPVIHLDLKNTKVERYESFVNRMRSVVCSAYEEHRYLLDEGIVEPNRVKRFQEVLDETVGEDFIQDCIPMLCRWLEKYHHAKAVILIDEYDSAVSDAFGSESHRPILRFLARFMGSALKGNDSLQMACITGIMQIAKESIFSDLNNLEVNNIFSTMSDERFGFTEVEVKRILEEAEHPEKFDEIKQWYDGYRFGDVEVYNPYSVMYYVKKGFKADPYWEKSGGDSVIRWMLEDIDDESVSDVINLVTGSTARMKILGSLTYSEVRGNSRSLYSLMTMSGYLKAVPAGDGMYDVSIPNEEVRGIVDRMMEEVNPIKTRYFARFNQAVLDGDADTMVSILQKILLEGSYMNLKENAYEIILMTLMHSLVKRYEVKTEHEDGYGRTDITLRSKVPGNPNMVFELKVSDSEKKLDADLEDAIGQIHWKRYYLGMPGKVILVGMSFYIKTPRVKMEVIDNGPDGLSYSPPEEYRF